MANATNIKLGVCSVSFGGVDLGHTKGGVEVTYEPKYTDITADLYGDTPIDKVLIGEKLQAKFSLAEKTIANLRNAMPQTEFAGAANARVTIGHKAGQFAKVDAQQLVLHPVAEGTAAFDIVLYKAHMSANVAMKHENNGETLIPCTFDALLDESRSDGNYLGLIGDSTK